MFLVIWRERTHRHGIDHVPVTINDMRTEYFVNVSVGSPRQTFTVLIDTASSTLAIFSKLAPTHGRLAVNDGELDRRLKVRLCYCGGQTNCLCATALRPDDSPTPHETRMGRVACVPCLGLVMLCLLCLRG